MKKLKLNAIGFGHSKNIKLGEGLIASGVVLVTTGLVIICRKTQWWIAGDQKTLDNIVKLYNSQKL